MFPEPLIALLHIQDRETPDNPGRFSADPIVAWTVDDTSPRYGIEGLPVDYVTLYPICLADGYVMQDVNRPPNCYVVAELSVNELETAVAKLVDNEWADEVYQAETAGLRWQIDDTVYLLTVPIPGDDAQITMPSASWAAFKIGDGGTWAVFDGVAPAEVAQHADRIDVYAAAFRAEHLLEAVKFVPVSVVDLIAAPTTERVARASTQDEAV